MVQVMEDRKIVDDVKWLRNKFESISVLIQNLKIGGVSDDEELKAKKLGEPKVKYLELGTFSDFKSTILKELNNLFKKSEDNNKSIINLQDNMNELPTIKDLKRLEEYLLCKHDEFKITSTRKFADKMDTFKNAKYLETQVCIK